MLCSVPIEFLWRSITKCINLKVGLTYGRKFGVPMAVHRAWVLPLFLDFCNDISVLIYSYSTVAEKKGKEKCYFPALNHPLPVWRFFNTFQVVITQMNGVNHPSESIHVFHVGKMRIKLCKGKTTIAKEYFSTSMQVLDHFISLCTC